MQPTTKTELKKLTLKIETLQPIATPDGGGSDNNYLCWNGGVVAAVADV